MQKRCVPLITNILVIFLLSGGLLAPLAAVAETTLRYGRIPGTNSYYLLPSRGYAGTYPYNAPLLTQGISASCAPMQLTGVAGQIVTWFSSVTGGSGNYAYSWSGSENLAGNASTVQKIYSASGEKFAMLSVTSAGQTVAVSCGSVVVGSSAPVAAHPVLGASCYATPERAAAGESVTWLSIVSGTNAATSYAWDGTENLSGDRPLVSKTYSSAGPKFALLTVTSGGARVVAACTNGVAVSAKTIAAPKTASAPPAVKQEEPDILGLCAPSAASAGIGEKVLWQAAVAGGEGEYRYVWSGDDALAGDTNTSQKIYETAGVKRASVTIHSGEKTATLACSPVEVIKKQRGLLAASFLSWAVSPFVIAVAALVAVVAAGAFIAWRERTKEDEQDEEDYKSAK